ncbi:MAG: Two-component transcriptional response regulator, LuxR family [uncultured Chloroflexi bacterium]|uniref:Two-component transcriptional response regulator, LuxR family n=1 Tax=uncultured Chloroflexota bacterium TaxID=166587 RepID=A0A6J4IAA6_9CHLR|nr:MAG: Two-component transcriptional response regulator, LuxR family [uncultured Chloroflexota bacterium]
MGGDSADPMPLPDRPIRVMIVDDHPIVREGLVAVLEDEADFAIVGTAGSAEEAMRAAPRLRPDVVVLDLELPGVDGVAAIPRLAEVCPSAGLVVLTAYAEDERVFGALQAGARGYLLKGTPAAEIARAIRVVHDGGTALDPRVATRVVADWRAPRRTGSVLTERERQVLRLVAEGRATKQIAQALSIVERTVKFHLASATHKLGAQTRAQAAALATRRGLL